MPSKRTFLIPGFVGYDVTKGHKYLGGQSKIQQNPGQAILKANYPFNYRGYISLIASAFDISGMTN